MKTIKYLVAVVLTLALSLSMIFGASAAESFLAMNGYTFTVKDNSAVIYSYNGGETQAVIPCSLLDAEVVKINDNAFLRQRQLTFVSFEEAEALNSIGSNAFCGCRALEGVSLPSTVTSVGFGAFQNCGSLESAELGGITEIPDQLFYLCRALKGVRIPDNVTHIGSFAFACCDSLDYLEIPSCVTSIDEGAFYNDNVTLGVYSGSYGRVYAEENDIPYVVLDGALLGDANGDGSVNVYDVTCIQRYVAGYSQDGEINLRAADIDGSGRADIQDATLLQMYLAQFATGYSVGTVA